MTVSRIKRRLSTYLRTSTRPFFILLGLSILGLIYYFLATAGPSRISDSTPKTEDIKDPVLDELSRQVGDLEKQYDQVASAGLQTPQALKALEDAIEKQKELIRRLPVSSYEQAGRLRQLETKRDSAYAREKLARIEQLDREGNAAAQNGDYSQAIADLSEALRLQQEINGSFAGTQFKNYRRETSLSQAITNLEVEPINKEKEAALAVYQTALNEKRWRDALVSLTTARDLQAKINYEHPRTRFTNLQALEKLNADIDSLHATDIVILIEDNEKAAGEAELVSDYPKAATHYAEAARLQREINASFPRSRFVSSPRVEEFEIKHQTALSRSLDHQLTQLDQSIPAALRRRHIVVAEEQLATALSLIKKLETEYPRSSLQNPARKLRLTYLNVKIPQLEAIQDTVYAQAAIIPALTGRLMASTEVTQKLYRQVMNTNPSRNPGDLLPVESVSWNEAVEFCQRLSWIMGLEVRLPTEAEYRAALEGGPGGVRGKDSDTTTTAETGARTPNEFGVHDLLGNVAEWLMGPATLQLAPHIGGSYLNAPDTLNVSNPPTGQLAKNERARHIGFRFILVQSPDEAGTPAPAGAPASKAAASR